MRRIALTWLILAPVLTGCGGSSRGTPNSADVGPHQGRLITLPEGAGFAEVVVEVTKTGTRAMTSEIAAYFYGPDAKSPLTPPPQDVAVQVYMAESKALETLALKPIDGAGVTPGRTRFAAVPPPGFDGMMRSGKLSARLSSGGFQAPF